MLHVVEMQVVLLDLAGSRDLQRLDTECRKDLHGTLHENVTMKYVALKLMLSDAK